MLENPVNLKNVSIELNFVDFLFSNFWSPLDDFRKLSDLASQVFQFSQNAPYNQAF